MPVDDRWNHHDAPSIVTEALTRECIEVAAQDDEAAEDKRRNMKFCDIESLAFSFRNLAKIDNLRGLDNLTMLKLDNNQIDRIEKLDHLVHLTWLDLSFNRISRIEGLSTMTKLTDLSLFDNRIQVIENLDECVSLHVISLGNNQLAKLDNVMYLRQFHNLRMVNLLGNPICHDPDYRSYVLSHIKGLSYLDYRRVCQSQVIAAKEQHQDEMIEIEEREEQQAQADAEMREKDQHLQLMAEANLDGVETLIDDMTLEDHEWERLNQIPGLLDEWGQLKDKFDAFTDEFKATILQQHEKKKAEYSEWLALAQKAVDDKDTAAKQAILEFEKKKKHAFLEVRENGQDVEHILLGPKVALMALKDKLMELEMETVDILQQLIQDFDRLYSEIIDANKQNYNQYFAMVRDQESKFAQQVTQSAMQIFEKYSQENSDTSVLPEEAKVLMSDKDVLMNSVQASHDAHTTKIDSLEDKLLQVEVKNADALVNKHAQWAYKRNRERVAEIVGYVEHTMMEMEELLVDPEDLE